LLDLVSANGALCVHELGAIEAEAAVAARDANCLDLLVHAYCAGAGIVVVILDHAGLVLRLVDVSHAAVVL